MTKTIIKLEKTAYVPKANNSDYEEQGQTLSQMFPKSTFEIPVAIVNRVINGATKAASVLIIHSDNTQEWFRCSVNLTKKLLTEIADNGGSIADAITSLDLKNAPILVHKTDRTNYCVSNTTGAVLNMKKLLEAVATGF